MRTPSAALAAALILTHATTGAKTISYTLSGVTTLNMVQAGDFTSEFPVGTKWSAVLEWDNASSALFLSDTQGQYRLTRFKITLQGKSGPWSTSSLPENGAFTLNLPFAPGGKHELQFTSGWGPNVHSNPVIENLQPYSANIILGDPTAKAITSLSPAPSVLKTSDWSLAFADSYLKFYLSESATQVVYGEVRSIQSNTAPEISVRQPADNELADAKGSRDFGRAAVNSNGATRTFTVRNTGKSKLSGIEVTKTGSHKGDFNVGDLPASSLNPGESMRFTVTFRPKGKEERTATLRIASNDEDENPFRIRLKGTGR